MSIFGNNITEKMSTLFRVDNCGFLLGNHIEHTPYVVPKEFCGLSKDYLTNYVVSEEGFDCVLGDRKKWIRYNEIFDVNGKDIQDLLPKIVFDGDFDKDLPMYTEENNIEHFSDLDWTDYMWSNYSVSPKYDTTAYWNIVANQIKENIRKHISKNMSIDVDTYACDNWIGNTNRYIFEHEYEYNKHYTRKIGVRLIINSINNKPCVWMRLNDRRRNINIINTNPWFQFGVVVSKIKCSDESC